MSRSVQVAEKMVLWLAVCTRAVVRSFTLCVLLIKVNGAFYLIFTQLCKPQVTYYQLKITEIRMQNS